MFEPFIKWCGNVVVVSSGRGLLLTNTFSGLVYSKPNSLLFWAWLGLLLSSSVISYESTWALRVVCIISWWLLARCFVGFGNKRSPISSGRFIWACSLSFCKLVTTYVERIELWNWSSWASSKVIPFFLSRIFVKHVGVVSAFSFTSMKVGLTMLLPRPVDFMWPLLRVSAVFDP